MAEPAEAPTTRRDVIAEQIDQLEQDAAPAVVDTSTPAAEPIEPVAAEPAAEKPSRTAGRARDESGRLLPGKADKPAVTPVAPAVAASPAPAVQEPVAQTQRPRWRKENLAYFDKIATENPAVAKQILEREAQFATGVSTYKQEADRAKELIDTLAPFEQDFKAAGVTPSQGIAKLANAHRQIMSAPEQMRPHVFNNLMRDYRVNARMVVQDAQGNWNFLNEAAAPAQQQPQQQPTQQQDPREIVREELAQQKILTDLEQFASTHPHYEALRATMSQLLGANLAHDLQSAHDAALKLPQHSDIADSLATQQSEEATRQAAAVAAAAATRARSRTISPKSATPSANSGLPAGKRDRRDIIAEQVDAMIGGRL